MTYLRFCDQVFEYLNMDLKKHMDDVAEERRGAQSLMRLNRSECAPEDKSPGLPEPRVRVGHH